MEPTLPTEPRVTSLATLTARPGRQEDLRQLLHALLEPTRKEPGCLQFDLNVALNDSTTFLLHGCWRSQADLDAHYKTPHLILALRRLDELCTTAPQIVFWQQVG